MNQYWFAPYRLNPEGRAFAPVAWQGFAVIAGFVVAFVVGVIGFVQLTDLHFYFFSIMWLALCVFGGGATFIWAAVSKRDPSRTVADYRANGVSN